MILVAGEALVDLVLGDDGGVAAHLGGGPFNCARALGRLEQPVAYLGRISSDRFGTRLRDQLEADGVSLDAVVATDDPTTLALAELDPGGAAAYRFYAAGTSAAGLEVAAALAALPDGVAMVHAGTLGLVFEPTADAVEAVLERLAGSALAMLDLNCRPAAIEDPEGYRARIARLLPRCHVIKASDADLEWLEPGRAALDSARGLLARGPALVLLTRGAQGATVVGPAGEAEVAAPAVEVVDTIGAGDAFGAAFLAWWRREGLGAADLGRDDAAVEATRFACRVAARTCERAGASPPRLSELG